MAEDAHDIQADGKMAQLRNSGGGPINLTLVPYDLLTDSEKSKNRERCQELLKYIQYQGYNLHKSNRLAHTTHISEANRQNLNLEIGLLKFWFISAWFA